MIAVIHTMSGRHPYPAGVYMYNDNDAQAATDLAVKLCLEQEPPDDEAAIRKDIEEEGVYRPEKYAEWSVSVVTNLGVGGHKTPDEEDEDRPEREDEDAKSVALNGLWEALQAASAAGVLDKLMGSCHPNTINCFCDATKHAVENGF